MDRLSETDALHEAAHAVVGRQFHFLFEIVTLDSSQIALRNGGWVLPSIKGLTTFSPHGRLDVASDRSQIDNWLIVVLVGYVSDCERNAAGPFTTHDLLDLCRRDELRTRAGCDEVIKHVQAQVQRSLSPQWGTCSFNDLLAACREARHLLSRGCPESTSHVELLVPQAQRLLHQPDIQGGIDRVATVLLAGRTLSMACVDVIVERRDD